MGKLDAAVFDVTGSLKLDVAVVHALRFLLELWIGLDVASQAVGFERCLHYFLVRIMVRRCKPLYAARTLSGAVRLREPKTFELLVIFMDLKTWCKTGGRGLKTPERLRRRARPASRTPSPAVPVGRDQGVGRDLGHAFDAMIEERVRAWLEMHAFV